MNPNKMTKEEIQKNYIRPWEIHFVKIEMADAERFYLQSIDPNENQFMREVYQMIANQHYAEAMKWRLRIINPGNYKN